MTIAMLEVDEMSHGMVVWTRFGGDGDLDGLGELVCDAAGR